jgi:suppressor of ftsI/bilirubin oxidase
MERRRVLQGLGAMGLAAFARTTHSGEATDSGALCTTGDGSSRPLYVPRDAGFLGRLAPRGAPLTIVAGPAGALPARVAHGPFAYRVRHDGRDFVNPSLILRRGERVRIALENRLSEPTIAHWHGLSVDTINDGSGLTAIAPREKYAYDFEVRDRGALYWYHPHPHGATARQTYQGLFGAIEVEDDDDRALRASLDLVPGRTEIALTLQDRRADPSYTPSQSDLTHGFFGDDLLVNGTHCPFLDIGSRLYRFRVLNACNARTLRLAFRTAAGTRVPFIVIGNDGGLLPAALRTDEAFLAAAERLDVLLDLRDAAVGDTVVLESLAFDPMHAEVAPAPAVDHAAMGHTVAPADASSTAPLHVHGGGWPEGAARAILALRVRTRITYDRALPTALPALAPLDVTDAPERPFRLGYNKGRWRINDRVFAMGETPIEVARDTTEIWLLRNYYTSMPHAMHLHGFHFEVLERETSPEFVHALAIDDRGRLVSDFGRKDTVLVWPGESVRVAIRFTMPFPGPQTYMFHCHNLEHEDGGMMLGVKVT